MWLGKRPKKSPKLAKSQNWLKTHPKVINAQNKCLFHHFGGMLAAKSGLRFQFRAPEVPFFGTWKRPLLPKVLNFMYQKMVLWVPKTKNGDHFWLPISPPKWWNRHLFCAYITFGCVLSQFWDLANFGLFWGRSPSHMAKNFQTKTYGLENFFWGLETIFMAKVCPKAVNFATAETFTWFLVL